MKETMNSIVLWLQGRKALFLAIAGMVISFLVTDNTLTPAVGTLLQSILSLLAGGALVVEKTQGFADFKLGRAK